MAHYDLQSEIHSILKPFLEVSCSTSQNLFPTEISEEPSASSLIPLGRLRNRLRMSPQLSDLTEDKKTVTSICEPLDHLRMNPLAAEESAGSDTVNRTVSGWACRQMGAAMVAGLGWWQNGAGVALLEVV